MQDLQRLFAEAVSLHQRNDLAGAEKLYLQVQRQLPDNTNVLANLGIVCRDLGKLDEAEKYCRQALASAPDAPDQYLNLGAVLEARKDFDRARITYQKALEFAPGHPKILNNLGKLLHQQGFSAQGLALIERAVQIEPNYPLALNNLGVIHSERGELSLAGHYLEKSADVDPENVNTLYNLAGLYNARNDFVKALAVLDRLLTLAPTHQAALHMQAALSGTTPPSAPRQYVEDTFDKYAHRFDHHLEKTLGYTAPGELAAMVRRTLPDLLPFAATLDLGCGTGLSGAAFKEITRHLTGVDLSARMLARAAGKKLYDRLEHVDILTFLGDEKERYDLFIAADVLVYLGDPQPFFSAIAVRARGKGVVACSIERLEQGGRFQLLPSGRYAHDPAFLCTCAMQEGFDVVEHQLHNIRKESGQWLAGDLFLFKLKG